VQINKGHFFSNGNKRLAIAVTALFLDANGFRIKNLEKEEFKSLLGDLFPEHKNWEDFEDFTATDFATYHLSIVVAESGTYNIAFDELKMRIKSFLESAIEKCD
jgi:prophage maintenance system killer protein